MSACLFLKQNLGYFFIFQLLFQATEACFYFKQSLLLIPLLHERVKENFTLQILLRAHRLEWTNIVQREEKLQGKAVRSSVSALVEQTQAQGMPRALLGSMCCKGILFGAIKARKKRDEGQERASKSCYLPTFLFCTETAPGSAGEAQVSLVWIEFITNQ